MSSTATAHALLRIALGIMFIAHGLLKVLVFTLPGTAQFFASIGLPAWSAYPVVAFELLGGLALLAGFHTRLVAWLGLPVLLGATWSHLDNGWLFTNANGGWEYPAFLAVAAIAVALAGPGRWALNDR